MIDADKLAGRIDALEASQAYQDDTIEKLNAMVTAQWAQIDTLKRLVTQLSDRLDESVAGASDVRNEKPPHY